jgi:hypothetical protein
VRGVAGVESLGPKARRTDRTALRIARLGVARLFPARHNQAGK